LLIKLSSRDVTAMGTISVRIKNNVLICEYARTEADRQHGLMDRRYLPANRGMLFDTFSRYRPVFHMKNVYIPLDAIFIGNDNKIVGIVPMTPLDASTVYTVWKNIPIKWVLETNRGYSSGHGIKVGDTVFLN